MRGPGGPGRAPRGCSRRHPRNNFSYHPFLFFFYFFIYYFFRLSGCLPTVLGEVGLCGRARAPEGYRGVLPPRSSPPPLLSGEAPPSPPGLRRPVPRAQPVSVGLSPRPADPPRPGDHLSRERPGGRGRFFIFLRYSWC